VSPRLGLRCDRRGRFFIHCGLFTPIISFNCWSFLLLENIEPIFAWVIFLRPSLRALATCFQFWPLVALLGCGDGFSNSSNVSSKFVSAPSSSKDSFDLEMLEELKCWTCYFDFDYTFDDFLFFRGDPYLHFKCFFLGLMANTNCSSSLYNFHLNCLMKILGLPSDVWNVYACSSSCELELTFPTWGWAR